MKNTLFIAFLASFFALGCNKPEPNPETRDPLYTDYLAELDLAKKSLEAEEKTYSEHETAFKATVPQTGQIRYARKRLEESKAKIDRLKQQVTYFELKVANRLKETRKKYLIAFNSGKIWPDPKEIEEYRSVLKLRRDKIAADHNERIPPKPTKKKEGASEAPPSGH